VVPRLLALIAAKDCRAQTTDAPQDGRLRDSDSTETRLVEPVLGAACTEVGARARPHGRGNRTAPYEKPNVCCRSHF
jgi:hypothetical protein